MLVGFFYFRLLCRESFLLKLISEKKKKLRKSIELLLTSVETHATKKKKMEKVRLFSQPVHKLELPLVDYNENKLYEVAQ